MTETLPDHVALERLPVYLDKEPRVFQRPRRQLDIRDPVSVLLETKVEPFLVEENLVCDRKMRLIVQTDKTFDNDDLWCAEQVWDELLHVGGGLATRQAPRVFQ